MKAYRLLVEINGIEPRVWRRILVPAVHNFFGLHAAIQISFGWLDFHLFRFSFLPGGMVITENLDEFEAYSGCQEKYKGRIPSPEEDPDGSIRQLLSKSIKQPTSGIELYFEQYKTFTYTYDFKDLWEHKITCEETITDCNIEVPLLLEGEGACPPEDVGGILGYRQFLEAWNDTGHIDHDMMMIWGKSRFYAPFDKNLRNKLLEIYFQKNKNEIAFIHPRVLTETNSDGACPVLAAEEISTSGFTVNRMLLPAKLKHNLSRLRQYVDLHGDELSLIDLDVRKWRMVNESLLDKEKIGKEDVERSVILIEIAPDYYEMDESIDKESSVLRCYALIDGRNQLLKAIEEGKRTIKACLLKVEEHTPFIVSGYLQFASYWNKELDYLPYWKV